MAYDFDPGVLLGFRPPTIPDPLTQAGKYLTLANLSDTQGLNALKLQASQRAQEADDAYNRVIGDVYANKFSPESISRAVSSEPKSAEKVLIDLERHRKAEGDYQEKSAKAYKESTDAKLAILKTTSQMAFGMADDPNLTPDMVKQWHSIVAANGLEKLIPTVPFQSWQNPESAKQVLRMAGRAFYEAHQQVQDRETNRHNTTEETMQRGNYESEAKRRADQTSIDWARFNQESLSPPQEYTVDGKPTLASWDRKRGRLVDSEGNVVTNAQPKNNTSATLLKDIAQNNVSIQNIDAALDAITERKNSLGFKNFLGDTISQWVDPHGVQTRALVAQIGGQKLHDLSGAAVSAGEANRLMPMIPRVTDTAEAASIKLNNLRRELVLMNQELKSGKSIFEVANAKPVNSGNQSGGVIGSGSITGLPSAGVPTITPLGR